jgi:polysaccharide export outer membrane protein
MTTSARVTEARRSLLFSSTRYLQTTAQLAQFQKDEADFRRKLEKLDDTRKSELLKELQESIVKSMSTYSRIKSVAEKQRIRGDNPLVQAGPRRATITIIREGANGPVSLLANEEAKLQPGDVVEAALRSTDFLDQKQAHAQ